MVRADPSLSSDDRNVWYGRYCTGRFWHTVRDDDGRAVNFNSVSEATKAARREWWQHVTPRAQAGEGVRYNGKAHHSIKSRASNSRVSTKAGKISAPRAAA